MEQYIRKDCEAGFLNDFKEIQYYKATQRTEIISNFMLGDFNSKGEYIIDETIIDELIKMPKNVINTFHDIIFCESIVVTEFAEQEKFMVKTISDENNSKIKISTLEVMESVVKAEGCIVNTLTTPIAQFVDIDGEQYYEKMFHAFNIYDANDFQQEELDKFARGHVSLRRKYVVALNHLCQSKILEANKFAYVKKIEILKKSGKIGEVALKSFEERLNKNPIIATQKNYKALNELLDAVVEVHKEKLEPVMPQIKEVGVQYAEKVENSEKFANQNLVNLQKTESGKIAIKTQQALVNKNVVASKQGVKSFVTDEAVNAKYRQTHAEQPMVKEVENNHEHKKEKFNLFKAFVGSVIPENNKKEQKADKKIESKQKSEKTQSAKKENRQENKKENIKESKEAKPVSNKSENVKEDKLAPTYIDKPEQIVSSNSKKSSNLTVEKQENTPKENSSKENQETPIYAFSTTESIKNVFEEPKKNKANKTEKVISDKHNSKNEQTELSANSEEVNFETPLTKETEQQHKEENKEQITEIHSSNIGKKNAKDYLFSEIDISEKSGEKNQKNNAELKENVNIIENLLKKENEESIQHLIDNEENLRKQKNLDLVQGLLTKEENSNLVQNLLNKETSNIKNKSKEKELGEY